MTRWVHILLLVVCFAFQAGTLLSVLTDCCATESAAECATDGCGEDCGMCVCAFDRPALSMPMVVLPAPVAPAREHGVKREVNPPEPRAGDILHVPRPALA